MTYESYRSRNVQSWRPSSTGSHLRVPVAEHWAPQPQNRDVDVY